MKVYSESSKLLYLKFSNLIVAFIEKLQMLMLAVQNSEAFLGPLQTMGVKNYDHEKFASLNYKISP
jgi:hypothetical protein